MPKSVDEGQGEWAGWLGRLYVSLPSEATRSQLTSRILFSACFAEACTLLGLVIAHELGALDAVWQFSISLHILLALVLLVLPFAQCLLFTYGGSASARRKSISSLSTSTTSRSSLSLPVRLLVAIVPYTLYIFLFTRLPPYITVHIDADGDGVEDWASWAGWVAPAMGRLVFMGVICLGGLSGFGAVRTAWMFYERTRIRYVAYPPREVWSRGRNTCV